MDENFALSVYLNVEKIAEMPPGTYQKRLKRAVEVSVVHFDREFFYFFGRRTKKEVTIFFRLSDFSRCWLVRAPFLGGAATIAEDRINIFINKLANYLDYDDRSHSLQELPSR